MKTTQAGLTSPSGAWRNIALIAVALVLTSCGDKPQPPAPQTAPPKLFQQDREALDKAKTVGQTESKSAEDLKQEEEKQAK